jgi:hypothetical protein
MQSIAIVTLSTACCIVYGVVHDQITVRICVEYFTVFHPDIFGTDNPTLLGLGWGVVATWWVGLFLGIPLAVVSRAGARPKRTSKQLFRPIGLLLILTACVACLAGLFALVAASNDWIRVAEPWASRIPADKHVLFLVDLWMHNGSYVAGFVGGLILIASVWHSRRTVPAAVIAVPTSGWQHENDTSYSP